MSLLQRVILLCCAATGIVAGREPSVVQRVKVYSEAGRFGGWPANHGMWSWGNEILVGFSAAYFKAGNPDRHQVDNSRPEEPRFARSLDGGVTWRVETPQTILPPAQGGNPPVMLEHPMNFSRPGFAMTIRFTNTNTGPSLLWYSNDKGKTWSGPFTFPMFGFLGVAARTDYIADSGHAALAFLTAAKTNGREGRPFCARTTDGGLTWKFVSFIGPEPKGFAIMPSTVRLSARALSTSTWITAIRVKDGPANYIAVYGSTDNAATWQFRAKAADTGAKGGNPPALIRLHDGRLCLTYGYRAQPFGIRAVFSRDDGKSWGNPIALRDDGVAWDVGYPRSVQRPDGKIVTVYYFNDAPKSERFIDATIWDPGE